MDPQKSLNKANSAMKTGIFKWSKDYSTASFYYKEAAEGFRSQNKYLEAIDAYSKLIKVNQKLNDNFGIGRAYNSILNCKYLQEGDSISKESIIYIIKESASFLAIEKSLNTLFTSVNQICKYYKKSLD